MIFRAKKVKFTWVKSEYALGHEIVYEDTLGQSAVCLVNQLRQKKRPTDDVLLDIADKFENYFAAKGSITLEEAFFGKTQTKK